MRHIMRAPTIRKGIFSCTSSVITFGWVVFHLLYYRMQYEYIIWDAKIGLFFIPIIAVLRFGFFFFFKFSSFFEWISCLSFAFLFSSFVSLKERESVPWSDNKLGKRERERAIEANAATQSSNSIKQNGNSKSAHTGRAHACVCVYISEHCFPTIQF